MAVKDPPSVYLTGTTEILTSGSGRQPARNRDSRHVQPTPIVVTIVLAGELPHNLHPRENVRSTQDFYVSLRRMYSAYM